MQAASQDAPAVERATENVVPLGLFPCLANPFLMALCDGVIGRQALTVDELGLAELVVAPGIFTDGKRIQSLPWELQDLSYSTGPGNESQRDAIPLRSAEASPHFVRGAEQAFAPFTLSKHVEQNIEVLACLSENPTNKLVVPLVLGSHRQGSQGNQVVTEWVGNCGEMLVCLGGTSFVPPPSPRTCTASPAFGFGSTCDSAPGFGPGINYHAPFLGLSYHAAYLRQRKNLFLAVPPPLALALPSHISRLLGYFKPGPVLNKLYCGSGNSDILEAFKSYNGRAVDWAGKLSSLKSVPAVANKHLNGDLLDASKAFTLCDFPDFSSPHNHKLPDRSRINNFIDLCQRVAAWQERPLWE
jgi:hypothetical protein